MVQEYQTEQQIADLMAQPVGSPGFGHFYGVSTSPEPQAQATTTPEQPQGQEPSTQTAGTSPPTFTQPPPSAPQAGPPKPAGSEFSLRGYSARAGPYSDLFAPVSQGLEQGFSGVAQEAGRFSEAAGPRRSFESVGGAGLFDRAFGREAGPKDISEARSLVQAQYTGPQTLDQEAVAGLRGQAEELGTRGRSLTSGLGVEDLLRTRSPGLTPGEYRYEAKDILADPLYRQAAQGYQEDIGQFQAEITGAEAAAGGLVTGRETDEAEIARLARENAEGRQTGATESIRGRVTEEEEYDAALRNLFDTFQASGKLEDLVALPGEEGEQIAADPEFQGIASTAAKRTEIESQFPDIQGIPSLEPQVSTRGRPVLGFPKEWYDANKGKYTPQHMAEIKQRVLARNAAFEAAGFSPGVIKTDPGELSAYDPLYFGQDLGKLEAGDLRPTVGIQEGTGISRETVATPEERLAFNRASEILGLADSIAEAEPRERPKIVGEIDLYLNEIERQITERKGALGTARDEHLAAIGKARKKYKRAVKAKQWKKVVQITTDVLTLGLMEAFPKQSYASWGATGRIIGGS